MRDEDLLALDLCAAAAGLAAGKVDPVALAEAYLRRIEAAEPSLNAYVTVDADGAREDARRARDELAAGRRRGPLHGVPVGVKDIVDTAGLRTTYGSIRYDAHVPVADAESVARLRRAGAVILGKHATHEFAWGGRTDNPHFGPTRNPHDPTRIPGGSSGGGAASVVARSSLLALGTDTAGSVRIPAALSGCVGFKPRSGSVPLAGVFPLAPSFDHVGVMARTVADASLAAGVLTGTPAGDVRPPERLTVGWVAGGSRSLVDAEVAAGVERAAAALVRAGVEVVDVDLPDVDERVVAVLTLVKAEAEAIHRAAYLADPGSYGPDLAQLLAAPAVRPDELAAARRTVGAAVHDLRRVLDRVDVVMTATVPVVAPPIGEMWVDLHGSSLPVELVLTRLTSIANAAGLPALSVPAPGGRGLPVGVQLIAGERGLPALLAVAAAVGG